MEDQRSEDDGTRPSCLLKPILMNTGCSEIRKTEIIARHIFKKSLDLILSLEVGLSDTHRKDN